MVIYIDCFNIFIKKEKKLFFLTNLIFIILVQSIK